MTGEDVRQVFEASLPDEAIEGLCLPFGVIERQRKLDLGTLVRAMVIAAGTPGGACQADVLRSYLESAGPWVARSAFSRWCDEPLEQFMAALAERALADARAQEVDLAGIVGGVKDWDSVDSTSLKTLLPAALIASIIAALLAHRHTLQTRPPQVGMSRTEAPVYPQRLALQLAVSCQSIAQAFELKGAAAKRRWQQIADLLTHAGKDPNWRRRPSVLDQLRGWKRQPGARTRGHPDGLKAVA